MSAGGVGVGAAPSRHSNKSEAAPPLIEPSRFSPGKFVESFPALAAAHGGLDRLRDMVLDLALHGALVPHGPGDAATELAVSKPRAGAPSSSEIPFTVPAHWCWTHLEHVVASVADGDHQPPPKAATGVPFLTIGNVSAGVLDFSATRFVARTYFDSLDRRRVPTKGDIIYTIVGSYGIPLRVETNHEFCVQRHIAILRPDETCETAYLYLFLRSPLAYTQATACATGIAQPTVGLKPLRRFKVPLPPVAEQKRIVAKVDELMRLLDDLEAKQTKKRKTQARLRTAALDALTSAEGPEEFAAAWRRVAENFGALFERAESAQVLRDLVFEMAFTGRLVGPRKDDDSAEALVQRAAAAWRGRKRKQALPPVATDEIPSSPSRWAWQRLGDLAEVVGGVTKGRDLRGRSVRSYPYLRVANVQRGFLDLRVMKEIEIPDEELAKYRLAPNDVLFTEGGDWDKLGRSVVWRGEIDPCIHQNHVFRARLVLDDLDPAWVSLFANSPVGRRYFENAAKQTTNLASINMTQLRHCPIPIPPLEEKRRIVAKTEHLMKLCDDLEAKLRNAEMTAAKLVEAVVQELVA